MEIEIYKMSATEWLNEVKVNRKKHKKCQKNY